MTTLTLEWEVTVTEKHRLVIDPDHDTIPFDTVERLYTAAVAEQGTAKTRLDVPESDLDVLREFIEQQEIAPKFPTQVVEEIDGRTITNVRITKPRKARKS